MILLYYSFQRYSLGGVGGWTFDNYASILTDPTYAKVMLTTVVICTVSMLAMLAIGIPLAYILAFRTKPRYELLLLLTLVHGRGAEPTHPHLRVAHDPRPRRGDQLVPAGGGHHRRTGRLRCCSARPRW